MTVQELYSWVIGQGRSRSTGVMKIEKRTVKLNGKSEFDP